MNERLLVETNVKDDLNSLESKLQNFKEMVSELEDKCDIENYSDITNCDTFVFGLENLRDELSSCKKSIEHSIPDLKIQSNNDDRITRMLDKASKNYDGMRPNYESVMEMCQRVIEYFN